VVFVSFVVSLLKACGAGPPSPPVGVFEHVLHRLVEQGGDAEGEIEGGVVLTALQGVDRLARDPEPLAKLSLRPALLLAQLAACAGCAIWALKKN
jgi:hypothetical protein